MSTNFLKLDTIITPELIDFIAPNHGRTSCSDSHTANGYGGWTGKYNPDTGKKEIHYPRCIRCYLLNNVDFKLDSLEFSVNISVSLDLKETKP